MARTNGAGKSSLVGGESRARLTVVAAAALAAVAIWALAEFGFGLRLRAPDFGASQKGFEIGGGLVIVTAGLSSLAGWGLLTILERLISFGRRVWVVIAVLSLTGSLGAPLSGTGVSSANRLVLVLMHLAVGAVLIAGLYRTRPARRSSATWSPGPASEQ